MDSKNNQTHANESQKKESVVNGKPLGQADKKQSQSSGGMLHEGDQRFDKELAMDKDQDGVSGEECLSKENKEDKECKDNSGSPEKHSKNHSPDLSQGKPQGQPGARDYSAKVSEASSR